MSFSGQTTDLDTEQRPIVVRQRQYAMLRPSADILALNLVDVPFKFVTIVFFDVSLNRGLAERSDL